MNARIVVLMLTALGATPVLAADGIGEPAPLLAWTDDPPAVEVRPLSGARTIAVRYGAALDPATFHATLDGERVTPSFQPEAGSAETVALDFIGGRNHLVLEASSTDGLSHVRLERWISFARFPGDENADGRLHSAPELKHELWKKETPVAPAPAAAPATKP